MSIFREHKTIADRAASDRSRHRHKIEKAIKESIRDVVAEESIIGQSGKKKIRIPVKGIKEHQLVFGQNQSKLLLTTDYFLEFEVQNEALGANSKVLPGIVRPNIKNSIKIIS